MLLQAVLRGRIYQVKFLLENKAEDVNQMDENGQTCLMKAIFLEDKISRTRSKLLKLLLRNGSKVNIVDKNGRTALIWASTLGKTELVSILLREAILDLDLNAEDLDGNTALHLAASKGYVSIVRMLIKALKRFGLDVDRKNTRGMTPMLEAAEQGRDLCAETLMTEGQASLTIRDSFNFLNTREWAEKRSLTNLSQLIARRSPTPSIPATDILGVERGYVKSNSYVGPEPHTLSSNQGQLTVIEKRERTESRVKSIDVNGHNKRNASEESRNAADTANEANHENTTQLWKRKKQKATVNSFNKPSPRTASSLCSLFSLYAVHNSATYRKGFDLTNLPPSGFYYQPPSDQDDSEEHLDTDLSGCESRTVSSMSRRRMSVAPHGNPDVSNFGRKTSNAGFLREGRKMSTITAFAGVATGDRRRKVSTVSQAPSNRANLIAEFSRKTSVVASGPGERRVSRVGCGENRRPSLAGSVINPTLLKMRRNVNTTIDILPPTFES